MQRWRSARLSHFSVVPIAFSVKGFGDGMCPRGFTCCKRKDAFCRHLEKKASSGKHLVMMKQGGNPSSFSFTLSIHQPSFFPLHTLNLKASLREEGQGDIFL